MQLRSFVVIVSHDRMLSDATDVADYVPNVISDVTDVILIVVAVIVAVIPRSTSRTSTSRRALQPTGETSSPSSAQSGAQLRQRGWRRCLLDHLARWKLLRQDRVAASMLSQWQSECAPRCPRSSQSRLRRLFFRGRRVACSMPPRSMAESASSTQSGPAVAPHRRQLRSTACTKRVCGACAGCGRCTQR